MGSYELLTNFSVHVMVKFSGVRTPWTLKWVQNQKNKELPH